MPNQLPAGLREETSDLIQRLRDREPRLYGPLAQRLQSVLAYDGPELRAFVRQAVWLADVNLFHGDQIHLQVLADAYAREPSDAAQAMADAFRAGADEARQLRAVVEAWYRFAWHEPSPP